MTFRRFAPTLVLVALGLATLAPAGASAASVAARGTTLNVAAKPGETNLLSVTPSGGRFLVKDAGTAPITDGDGAGGCSVGPTGASCAATGITRVIVRAGDGDDRATVTTPTDDLLTGGDGADLLRAEAGRDDLFGEAGADTLLGGSENDRLDGGTEADVLSGGPGKDQASYGSRSESVEVTINNAADDGSSLDGGTPQDNVKADIERVTGGSADDTLVGNSANNLLVGGPGNDMLRGSAGTDTLAAGAGQRPARRRGRGRRHPRRGRRAGPRRVFVAHRVGPCRPRRRRRRRRGPRAGQRPFRRRGPDRRRGERPTGRRRRRQSA